MPNDIAQSPSQNPIAFGEIIAKERKALGKTQAQIAEEVGVDRKTIRQLENGGNVRMHTMFCVLTALGRGIKVETMHTSNETMKNTMSED